MHPACRSEEHTSELQSRGHLVCRLLLEKKNTKTSTPSLPSSLSRLLPPPPRSTLFPYTTLFRSSAGPPSPSGMSGERHQPTRRIVTSKTSIPIACIDPRPLQELGRSPS